MKATRILLALVLALSVISLMPATLKKAEAVTGLVITTNPSVLTAGLVSEMVDPAKPFTIIVQDGAGWPVDLTRAIDGSVIDSKIVWNQLFQDPHPDNRYYYGSSAKLPQYYWTRTDLHDDDGSDVCNRKLFNRNMIEIDFSGASRGIYVFKGFVVNDEGEFAIKVLTPDRRQAGTAKIQVKLPIVTYEIINTGDPQSRAFEVPDDPDFIMTACDNRIYNVKATVMDAEGRLVKGITSGIQLCTGVKRTTRFTPFSTRPANYENATDPTLVIANNFYGGSATAYFLSDEGSRYDLHIGLDLNNNGQLEWTNKELYSFGPQYVYDVMNKQWTGNLTYFNTTCVMYTNGEFSTHPFFDLPPADKGGWGLGCIYNSPHFDGMVFANFDENRIIDYRDSLNLDVNGQTSFYIFAEDVCWIGGLVGDSLWGDMDIAGRPPSNENGPSMITSRWRGDGVYYLDFDAIPQNLAKISPPIFKLLDAETREELPKEFFDYNNYDLVYGIQNHVIVTTSPADTRDLPMSENGQAGFLGNQHENAIYGAMKYEERYNDVETTIVYTPTGTGPKVVEFRYQSRNGWYYAGLLGSPINYFLHEIQWLDVYKGLQITIDWDQNPEVGISSTAFITCNALGTVEPVSGALISIKGGGVETTTTTGSNGRATVPCIFTKDGSVVVTATKNGYRTGDALFRVGKDKLPPDLKINELPELTKEVNITVSGRTEPNCKVTISGVDAIVDATGKFMGTVKLEFGSNKIEIISSDPSGNKSESVIVVTLDNIAPVIMLEPIDKLVDVQEVIVKGRVEPGSRVRVGSVEAEVINDLFRVVIPVGRGINDLIVVAQDKIGNTTEQPLKVTVWHKTVIQMLIGSKSILLDGNPMDPELRYEPYISKSRTMVPIRAISQAIGAKVDWLPEDKSVIITMQDGLGTTLIIMRVGSKIAYVNSNPIELDVPPEIKNGSTFVPIRFIAENMGATVNYDAQTRTVTIERVSY